MGISLYMGQISTHKVSYMKYKDFGPLKFQCLKVSPYIIRIN
jgi:hypothetical protein